MKSIRIVAEPDTRINKAEAIMLFEDSNLFWFTLYNQKSTNLIMMTVFKVSSASSIKSELPLQSHWTYTTD